MTKVDGKMNRIEGGDERRGEREEARKEMNGDERRRYLLVGRSGMRLEERDDGRSRIGRLEGWMGQEREGKK